TEYKVTKAGPLLNLGDYEAVGLSTPAVCLLGIPSPPPHTLHPRLRVCGGGEGMPPRHLPPAAPTGDHALETPSGCIRLFELRHTVAVVFVPAQSSESAAPPLRSVILGGQHAVPGDRQSCELTRLAPGSVSVKDPRPAHRTVSKFRGISSRRRRPQVTSRAAAG